MILKLQESNNESDISYAKWDLAFIGEPIDDRGKAAIEFALKNSKENILTEYNADEMSLKFADKLVMIDDLDEEFRFIENKRILIESTTVNFVELLLILKQVKNHKCKISILYLEPKSYSKKRAPLIVHRREFELSEETPGFYPIPGFINSFTNKKLRKTVFIVGYESERIDRAIEENAIVSSNCDLIFGVPAFTTGWEMNSFANNIRVVKEQRLIGDPHFSSANNPGTTYDVLENIYQSLESNEEMFIAPLGPKPGGIATAIFLVENEDVNVLYDHPSKKKTRSRDVNKWHLYEIEF